MDYNPYAVYAPAMQGMSAMQNMGQQLGSGFALANMLSSMNAQQQYGPASDLQQEYLRQQGQSQRLNAILPLLLQSFGGGGGAGGFTTNYGASATYNSNPQDQQVTDNIARNRELYEDRVRQGITGSPGGGLVQQQVQQAPSPGQTIGLQPQAQQTQPRVGPYWYGMPGQKPNMGIR